MVRADFKRQLDPAGARDHIHMGDLFDKPQVAYSDLLFAINIYRAVADENPDTDFWIIQGNHDDSRDLNEVTAWDIFRAAMEEQRYNNINCITEPWVSEHFAILPWDPTMSATDMLEGVAQQIRDYGTKVAYGHYDVDPRSAHHNLIPTKELAALGITRAFTGHIHKPDTFRRDGVDVTVVGSMQPYAQGEDGDQSDHIRYVTIGVDDLDGITDFANCCVRLQLQPGEQYEGPIPECRSWDVQRMQSVELTEAPADISLEGFEVSEAYRKALDAHDIVPLVRQQIDTRWLEAFGNGG